MKAEKLLKEVGIEMTDFISSSTYAAVVGLVEKLQIESDELDKDNANLYNETRELKQRNFELQGRLPSERDLSAAFKNDLAIEIVARYAGKELKRGINERKQAFALGAEYGYKYAMSRFNSQNPSPQ